MTSLCVFGVYPPGQHDYIIDSQNGELCSVIGIINSAGDLYM